MSSLDARYGRSNETPYRAEESETVLERDDHLYARNLDELMEMFRAAQRLLDEMGFQEIHENYSEHWETLPFKTQATARMWKDPYTAIALVLTLRVKEPRSDRKTDEDVYKVKLTVRSEVEKYRYPNWNWFQETSYFKRSAFYQWAFRLVNSILFRKEHEKYKEEAEEIGLQFISQIREIEGSLPAIGRSKREYYNPNRPR